MGEDAHSAGAARSEAAIYRLATAEGGSGTKLRRPGGLPAVTPGLDLASRLRVLRQALRSRVERREALIDMIRTVNQTLEPARIAETILERAASWVPAPHWALVSADLAGQSSILAGRGLPQDMESAAQSIAAWVMQRDEEFMSADLRNDPRVRQESAGAAVAFPLSCRSRKVGAVIGLDRQPSARSPHLPAAVVRSVRVLLEPAAVALDNALLMKRVEALSVTDDLTHLYNSRYLNQALRAETKRASRSGRPLSLLFIDLDGFKRINDAHGHLFGSRALVEAASVIRGSARETDVVARFGGDEFAIVLPETGGDGAVAVGERVRNRIAGHTFLAGYGFDIHLTASVGVATLPDAAQSADQLVQAADEAMYRVKQSGKNGIQVAAPQADK